MPGCPHWLWPGGTWRSWDAERDGGLVGAAEETADFAALLRELKERSGLSYEALAKQAHMSTSTLHRYCKGEGVPADNAAVARFARVCKATPEELSELLRRWVLADAMRERARRAADAEPDAPPPPVNAEPAMFVAEPSPETVVLADAPPARIRAARKRWGLLAAGTAAAVAVSTVTMVILKGGGTDAAERGRPVGNVASSEQRPSDSPATHAPTSAPVSPSASPSRAAAPTAPDAKRSSHNAAPGGAQGGDEVPLTVTTRAHTSENQCGGWYLINLPPSKVPPPPPVEQDEPGWVKANGAIAADMQRVALTVQGTGDETVVIESMYIRVVSSSAPPAWNEYRGWAGCGGGVETRSFDTDLDAVRPVIAPKAGQRGFPYKVSQSDPEVLYITGNVTAHDVSWYVELQWSSGGRQGTIRIDDHGKPFRTSGSQGRPVYAYPIGDTQWTDQPDSQN
ncbi:helix-turn-helix domain-containing protein [Streptomyces sp. NPDC058739]|uniref:helix-turn-helix domain-containing protein n=1 Tax=Streptomyces sp. NPDC058739 TaxID=3346618 RepID=UPI0036A3F581